MNAAGGSSAPAPFRGLPEVRELVESFERCTLDACEWNHRAHLAVAMWYLIRLPEPAATERMIRGIQRFNYAKGIKRKPRGGYHETITLFWLGVGRRVRDAMAGRDPLAIINGFLQAPRSLPLMCYSRECLWSDRARRQWVEPDLAGIEAAPAVVLGARGAEVEPS